MTTPRESTQDREARERVLLVCTGNICRSPVAERLFRLALGSRVDVGSAGTCALRSEPIAPGMASLLQSIGADSAGFAARQLTPQLLSEARLVLTMTRLQRAQAVEMLPQAVKRSFTLVEFARLLRSVPGDQLSARHGTQPWAAVVPLAAARRGQAVPSAVGGHSLQAADDIDDPYGRSPRAYTIAFEHIHRAVGSIAQVMGPLVGVTG